MTKIELEQLLLETDIAKEAYCLEGGLPDECYCLNENFSVWEVYYSERGLKTDLEFFSNESDACDYFYEVIKRHLHAVKFPKVKSKITWDAISWVICALLFIAMSLAMLSKALKNEVFTIGGVLFELFLISGVLLMIRYLKHVKYIIVKKDKIRYYSVLYPFGRTLKFSNYKGKLITSGDIKGIHYDIINLIDHKNITAVKLKGLHYKNFSDIDKAIKLKRIGYRMSMREDLKLIFLGRIKLKLKK